jgi:hypothetical protein
MTSKITTSTIDPTYPVAGQNNSTQGFRDNFGSIVNNLNIAALEISALQANTIASGSTSVTNLQGATIINTVTQNFKSVLYAMGLVSGTVAYDYSNGDFQTMTLNGSVVLSLTNFTSASGSAARIRLQVTVVNTGYTLTLPSSVSVNIDTIAGAVSQTITFSDVGIYTFELVTLDGGTTFSIFDLSRSRDLVQGGSFVVQNIVNNVATPGITMTVSNVSGGVIGNITATNFIGNIISTGNSVSFTGNVVSNVITANAGIYGNISTPIQTGITLVGTLSSVSISGNANVGNLVVTNLTDMCGGDAYGVQYVAATNTGSQQIYSNVGFALINPTTSTIASYTIIMPATPFPGQVIRIGFANTITTLTQSGSGSQTVYGAFTTANTTLAGTWIYYTTAAVNSGNGVWYRIG